MLSEPFRPIKSKGETFRYDRCDRFDGYDRSEERTAGRQSLSFREPET
jgi:hypothetical protein